MTTIIAISTDAAIRIFSDTAVVEAATGNMVGMCEKVLRWHDRPLAVAMASNDLRASSQFTQDHIVPLSRGKTVEATFAALEEVRRPTFFFDMSEAVMLFAGILAGGKPRMSLFALGKNSIGLEPWKLTPVGDCVVLANVGEEDGLSPNELIADPEKFAPKWFQASRKKVRWGGYEFSGTGGHLQMTVMNQLGSTIRAIAYWPDWLGEPIDPARRFVPILRR